MEIRINTSEKVPGFRVFFGDNCKQCAIDHERRKHINYDLFLTNEWDIPNPEAFVLLNTISPEYSKTLNPLSFMHPNLKIREVTKPIFIYLNKNSAHKIDY